MRTNLPVTGVEVVLSDDALIVSKTDLKGLITYVNDDFLKYSGFNEAELIGQPHNLVRHPDMPVEAFKDLWDTLKEGRPWTGYVKNRCKNGDHYWVLANATPIWESGQLVGYLSARRKPSRDMVAAHESAYQLFREKRQGKLKIRYGKAVSGNGGAFANMTVGGKLAAFLGGIAAVAVALSAFSIFSMSKVNDSTTELYERRLLPTQEIGKINKLIADNQSQALAALFHDPASPASKHHDHPASVHIERIEKNIQEVSQLWQQYQPLIHSETHQKLAQDFADARRVFLQEALMPIMKSVQEGRYNEGAMISVAKMRPTYAAVMDTAAALLDYQTQKAAAEHEAAAANYAMTRNVSIGVLLLALVVGGLLAARFIAALRKPLQDATDTMRNITQGNYSNVVDIERNDELGKMLQGLQMMQTRMGFEVVDARKRADEMLRVKIALDNVSTGVMIADAGRNIIYTNRSVERILKEAEPAIRQVLPNFDAEHLMGKNIDIFHKNPSHQANLLANLQGTHTASLEVGGRHMTVTASPVVNERGQRLGAVAEWRDRTAEVMVEKEVESIVYAAAQGDFTRRLALDGKQGFFLSLAKGLNTLLETSAVGLQDVADVLSSLSQGDLTRHVEGDYQGTFGQLRDDTNLTINQLKSIIESIQMASDAINTAAKEIAAGNTDLSSRTEEQASSLEETASSMEQLSSTVKQNAANAGDAHRVAEASRSAVEAGGEVFNKVVATMRDIHTSSSKITDIIGVIDGIAFQTNILALNAAVEAARAGEQGRGFAVVATEVRSLAQRSAAAAKEIKTLIEASSSKVEEGTHLVSDASKAMDSVKESIVRVAALVGDIASASAEQSSGIAQVTLAVSQMDEVTQQNAALVEEAAAAAESLEDQAQTLNEAVSVFRLNASSGGRAAPASRGRPASPPPVVSSRPAPSAAAEPRSASRSLPPSSGDDEWEEF